VKVSANEIAAASQFRPNRHAAANASVASSLLPWEGANASQEDRMTRSSLLRKLSFAGALVSAISLAGAAAATTPPMSTHASPKAVAAAVTGAANAAAAGAAAGAVGATNESQDAHALAVSTAAQSDTVGGAHQNHGGYVSCVARGGSDCTSTTPTLPSHATLPTAATTHRP